MNDVAIGAPSSSGVYENAQIIIVRRKERDELNDTDNVLLLVSRKEMRNQELLMQDVLKN